MKTKSKKTLLLFAVVLLFFVVFAGQGAAQTQPTSPTINCGENYVYKDGICEPKPLVTGGLTDSSTLMGLIAIVLKYLLIFAGVVAVVFVVVGGYQYLSSGGNEEQAEKGRKTLINAVLGVVGVILAYTIITVITNLITSSPNTIVN